MQRTLTSMHDKLHCVAVRFSFSSSFKKTLGSYILQIFGIALIAEDITLRFPPSPHPQSHFFWGVVRQMNDPHLVVTFLYPHLLGRGSYQRLLTQTNTRERALCSLCFFWVPWDFLSRASGSKWLTLMHSLGSPVSEPRYPAYI